MNTILHMIETGGTGGAETVYLDIIRELDPARWRHIAVLPTREWMYEQLTDRGVEPILVPERASVDINFIARMLTIIRQNRVDLIHGHLFGSAVRAAFLARICGIPAVATLHGRTDLGANERWRSLKVSIANRGLRRIVFVSETLRREFLASVPLRVDRTTVIPNGINPQRFHSANGSRFRAEFGIAPNEFVIGGVGNPRPAKGFDVFLNAAAILKQQSSGYRFVVAGDLTFGRGDALFAARSARGLEEEVVITGFRSDIEAAFAAFDLYALTSRSEGFSLSLVEAMASALPVVATKCGGPEEIVEDGVTGVLVENGSAEAVAAAISRLRGNPAERARLGAAARSAVVGQYTLEAQMRAYERVYEECLDPTGRRTSRNGIRAAQEHQRAV